MTREEAIEVINSLTGKDFPAEYESSIARQYQVAEALMMGIEALKDDVPDTNVGKWVSCSERLPEDGTEVFVYLFERKDPYIAWVEDDRWYTEDFEVEKENYPIAWTELPKPYREEQP